MVTDGDVDMVEDVVGVGLGVIAGDNTGILGVPALVYVAAHWEPRGAVLLLENETF